MTRLRIIPTVEVLTTSSAPDRPQAAPGTLAATLADVATLGERFALSTTAGPDTVLATEFLDDDDLIDAAVAARGAALGSPAPGVAATLFLQGYAYRLAAPVLGAWVLHRRVPDVSAANVELAFHEGLPVDVRLVADRVAGSPGDALPDAVLIEADDLVGEVVRVLLDGRLMDLHDRLRQRHRLGATIARGALASQIGMALTHIDGHGPAPWQQVAGDAVDLFRRTRDRIGGEGPTGDVVVLDDGERVGMTWRRRTCCLVFCCAGREACGGCSRRTDDERAAVWAARLAARPRSAVHAGPPCSHRPGSVGGPPDEGRVETQRSRIGDHRHAGDLGRP